MSVAQTDLHPSQRKRAWPALFSLVIGFFMILVDQTIVSVAMPHIMTGLDADVNDVVWVTSAYLLAFAVPLLVTGRLGDRFGPKNVYLVGITTFTLSSAWCGFATSIEQLILARVVQGLGGSMMTPQTMAVITRMFPPKQRGAAMGLWGGVAGFASLAGPMLGGVIIDGLDWRWIFFINLPVGIVAIVAVSLLVPQLPRHTHTFDLLGVVLSAVGMFLLVFGIQEGAAHDFGPVPIALGPVGLAPPSVGLVVAGVVVLALFVSWQAVNRSEPLLPLRLFRTRDFTFASLGICVVGFVVTSMSMPMMLYLQVGAGLSPIRAAAMLVPMAVISGVLAPFMGKLAHGRLGRGIAVVSLACLGVGLGWFALWVQAQVPVLLLLVPSALLGLANGGMWGALSMAATRDLPMDGAGAGAGVYNTLRQVGAVIGSAGIAATMEGRLVANGLPTSIQGAGAAVPAEVAGPFSNAMGQSLLLPAAVSFVGVAAALFLTRRDNDGAPLS
ncbi:DHA2 family efflux MFS transporter permease subunit [Tessaracoccus rhinocerotis]|uniref:DHA2 family efflux MFS transporter permease subunit n=1 Tax=Tessaracoccus rhinocerotis TaxID=1689449 RepID=A0A553K5P0_9ACTN|nr:DHA2 family efflux MFS transporter permease subunit [Tessaracoccus rhinocerotis]TRY20023.1 DHA2 family efflux MFS transporter permease subunit [Tessaracoccus rhinocerotis]